MAESISGLHARPDPWSVEETDFEKAKHFKWVLIPLYSYNGDTDWLAKQRALCWRYEAMGLKIVYRLCSSGWQKPADYVAEWLPVLADLPEGSVQMDNEPNHAGENFGGSGDKVAVLYNEYWLARRNLFKAARPDLLLGFPGLAVAQRDMDWLTVCRDSITYADFLGCHVYWQYENWDDSAWGMRYLLYHAAFPEKDIIITEYGDSTPGRASGEKAMRYRKWLALEPQKAGVKAACVFVASSPDPVWAEFQLTEEDCVSINEQEEPRERWEDSPNYTVGRTHEIDLIIIHSTRGGTPIGTEAKATINWFLNPNSQASAHALITQTGQLVHFVSDYDTAWGAGELNPRALQVELEQPDNSTPFSPEQIGRLVEVVQWWCAQHQIPMDGDHIKPHDETEQGRSFGKTDVGKMFPWKLFQELLGVETWHE